MLPPHFTNIQHGLQLGRQFLSAQDTPNRQIVLITDGLPTAHFEGEMAVSCSIRPTRAPRRRRCARACSVPAKGSRSTSSCLQSWNQSEEDVRFAYRLAESTRGRVFFTAGRELDRYVVWDYIKRRKQIIA